MAVYQGSRYINTSLSYEGSTLVLSIRKPAVFNSDNFTYYTVIAGDTIDGIAYNQYGNSQLYWAILDANPQYQSELEIRAGDILSIPDAKEVAQYYGT